MKSLIILISLVAFISSHSTYYPDVDFCNYRVPNTPFSWHIHVVYNWQDEAAIAKSMELRDRAAQGLGLWPIPQHRCRNGLFHNPDKCIFGVDARPAGPFITAQWAVYFNPEDYTKFVTWFALNADGHDYLIHPNTGCDAEDHSWWTLWHGNAWPIRLEIWAKDKRVLNTDTSKFIEDMNSDSPRVMTKEMILNSNKASDLMKNYLNEHESAGSVFYLP